MPQSDKDIWAVIDSLLIGKQFQEADHILGQIDIRTLSDENKHIYDIQYSELFLYTGHSDKIDKRLLSAINYFRKTSFHEHFARAKYLHGWHLQQLGEYRMAQEVLTEAYLTYLRFDNLRLAARALNRLAYIQFQLGSIQDAVRSLDKSIDLYSRMGDTNNCLIIKTNMALMLFRSGNLQKALGIYQSLEKDISSIASDHDRSQVYLAEGLTFGLKGNLTKAYRLLNKCSECFGASTREYAIYLEYLGWLKLLEGKLSEAEKNLTEAVNMGLRLAPESDLVSQTKRLLAEVYIAQGKFAEAKKTGAEALAVAAKIGERAEIAGAHRALAQCAYHEGDTLEAREHYFQALNIYQSIDYRYELAIARYLAVVSGLYDKTESSAMLYLSAEYFRSEDIVGWPARVEQARTKFPVMSAAKKNLETSPGKATFIAVHALTRKAKETAEAVAATDMTILLTGPTGSGKDCLAEYIHDISGRTGKFISLNCAAIPDSMIEAELFGHCRGSFTGASYERAGLFEEAHGGTLYLNEIADASAEFQVKLLQAIENKKVRKIGSNDSRPVDIRIIAAGNQSLKELISARKFRPDLYYRLNEVVINLPALSDRTEDIPALARYFWGELGIKPDNGGETLESIGRGFMARPWPGNVRELKAEIRRLWSVSGGCLEKIREILAEESETLEERLIRALLKHHGNKSAVARELGVSEGTVRNYFKRSEIESPAN